MSKRLAALEERLGARLLHRTTRRLSLTPEGARLYERCLQMLQVADELPELVKADDGELRGVLRVNCSSAFAHLVLGDAIAELVKRHAGVQVELSVGLTIRRLARAPTGLPDRAKPCSCEQRKARRGSWVSPNDRGATPRCEANPRVSRPRVTRSVL